MRVVLAQAAWVSVGALLLFTRPLSAEPAGNRNASPQRGPSKSLNVACAAEQFTAKAGTQVTIHAWVTDPQGLPVKQSVSFEWKPTQGTISGAATATWTLPLVKDAPQKLSAKLRVVKGGAVGGCELELFVAPKSAFSAEAKSRSAQQRGSTLRGSFVTPNLEPEDKTQFGLYSYLLFRFPPAPLEKERFKAIVLAYLEQLDAFDAQSDVVVSSELNLFRLPLRSRLALPSSTEAERDASASLILEKYDYHWAANFLSTLKRDGKRSGPYLVVSNKLKPGPHDDVLLMDMNSVTQNLAISWLRSFVWLTAQKRSWVEKAVDGLERQLGNMMSVVALETKETVSALAGGLIRLNAPPRP